MDETMDIWPSNLHVNNVSVVRMARKQSKGGNPYLKQMHEDGRFYGKYKVKPNTVITIEDLQACLEGRQLSSGHIPKFVKHIRDKSYVAILYHLGARKLEPTHVMKEDITMDSFFLHIRIPAFKSGERGGVLKLPLDRIGMEHIIKQWKRTRKKRPVWVLSKNTSYRIIVRALGVCPHWLRHSFITKAQKKLTGTPSDVDSKIMSWTGIKSRKTLDNYRMKTEIDIAEVAEVVL